MSHVNEAWEECVYIQQNYLYISDTSVASSTLLVKSLWEVPHSHTKGRKKILQVNWRQLFEVAVVVWEDGGS